MLNTIKVLTFYFLFFLRGCLGADATQDNLPQSAKAVVDKMEQAINKSRMETLKALDKLMDAETKKGNLNGALAIRAKGEEIQKLMEDGKDLLGNPIDPDIAGDWKRTIDGKVFTFDKSGTVSFPGGSGKWTLTGKTIKVEWIGLGTEMIDIKDDKTMVSKGTLGNANYVMTRVSK